MAAELVGSAAMSYSPLMTLAMTSAVSEVRVN